MLFKILVLVVMGVIVARAGVVGKEIVYTADSLTLKGYLAYNDSILGKRPGILVVHEWWGINEYARNRATMLADLGYVALAVDMYGDGKVAAHPNDAGKFAGEVMKNMPAMKARFMAALELLKKDEHVDPAQIGAIGYCFGGGVILNMARQGVYLRAAVSFHGSLATQSPAKKGSVKAKILVCNGADDKYTTDEDIKKFKTEMKSAGADFRFINFPGAVHGFTNPGATELGKKFGMTIAYNESADKKSWEEMEQLFRKTFKR